MPTFMPLSIERDGRWKRGKLLVRKLAMTERGLLTSRAEIAEQLAKIRSFHRTRFRAFFRKAVITARPNLGPAAHN